MPHSFSVLALALALSGVGLLGGPIILSLGRGRALTAAIIEGLTLGLVPTMVVLRLLPHVSDQLGVWAVVLTGSAFFVLRGFDRAHHRAAARVGRAFIYTALLFHSFTDGVGLAAAVAASSSVRSIDLTLTLAFVVHRLPEGLFIATTLLPSYGMRRTLVRIGGLVAATLAGGLLGGALLPHLPERVFDAVVALGLGAMLQLVVHSHAERTNKVSTRALSSLALVAGVAAAVLVPAPHDLLRVARPKELPMIDSLGPLFVETAPMFVLALVLGAAGGLLPPPRAPTARANRSTMGAILGGLLFGARLPLGPAGAIPAARGLLAQGATMGAAVAFLIASATLGLDGLLLSARLLGLPWTVARYLGAILLVVACAWVAAAPAAREREDAPPAAEPGPSPRARLAAPLRALDQRAVWYLLGLVVASGLEAGLPQNALDDRPGAWFGMLAIALSVPFHVALITLLPSCMVFIHKGMSTGSVIALALVVPALHGDGLRLIARAGFDVAARVVSAAICIAGVLGLYAGRFVQRSSAPPVHELVTHQHTTVEWIAAGALALGIAVSLVRLGPRLWLGQLALFGEGAVEEHDYSHEHEHAPIEPEPEPRPKA